MEKRNTKRTRIRAGIEIQGEEGYKNKKIQINVFRGVKVLDPDLIISWSNESFHIKEGG